MESKNVHIIKVIFVVLFLWIFNFLLSDLFAIYREFFIKNNANELIGPLTMLLEFGIALPCLLKFTGVRFGELGINTKNIGYGALLVAKYFLWVMVIEFIVDFILAYPTYASFSGYHWSILKFFQEGWYHLFGIFLIPVLWEEILTRGLLFSYFIKSGFDKRIKIGFFHADQTILFTAIFFAAIHFHNVFGYGRKGIQSLQDAAYIIIILLLGTVVGYLFGLIRRKTDSLFWPILLHTLSNFGDWFIANMLPVIWNS